MVLEKWQKVPVEEKSDGYNVQAFPCQTCEPDSGCYAKRNGSVYVTDCGTKVENVPGYMYIFGVDKGQFIR